MYRNADLKVYMASVNLILNYINISSSLYLLSAIVTVLDEYF
jgi:hypothetical protein